MENTTKRSYSNIVLNCYACYYFTPHFRKGREQYQITQCGHCRFWQKRHRTTTAPVCEKFHATTGNGGDDNV